MCSKALTCIGALNADGHVLDTVRTLALAQDEVSSTDVSRFLAKALSCNLEIADGVLSLDPVRDSLAFTEREEELCPALGAALRNYGAHITSNLDFWETQSQIHITSNLDFWETQSQTYPAKCESIIRKLLRIGVDVHAQVPRGRFFHSLQSDSFPCTLSPFGTPLDELFTHTTTTEEAKDVSDAWLTILSTEGIDVSAYLEKEAALHATRQMFTCPQDCDICPPRQLVFELGAVPTVYTDWWIDPQGALSLLRQEFKDTNILNRHVWFMWETWRDYDNSTWKSVWPISYPTWSEFLEPWRGRVEDHATWERLSARAQERAYRRWQKKARIEARRNGTHADSSMPGAWPE